MVLTAIPTAIHGRPGVFAGGRCRTDSLAGKDFRTLAYGSGRVAGNFLQTVNVWRSRSYPAMPTRPRQLRIRNKTELVDIATGRTDPNVAGSDINWCN